MAHLSLILLMLLLTGTACGQVQEVSATEVLQRAADGEPIHLEGARIVGSMNLSDAPQGRLEGIVLINCTVADASLSGLTIEGETILSGTSFGNASFDDAHFMGMADLSSTSFVDASFSGTAFDSPTIFDGASFQGDVSFEDAAFALDASFNHALFGGAAIFNYSRFGYYTYFSGAQFLDDALFSNVRFQGTTDFTQAIFRGHANFFETSFASASSFSDGAFAGPAHFGMASFGGLSSFGNVLFEREANFALARFSDAAYFADARFEDDALFGLTKFEDVASFQGASFQADLNFKGGSISTLLLERASYGPGCRIVLNDTDFNRIKAPWSSISRHVVWDPGAYLALVESYHRMGWPRDEDDCYYQYRRMDQDGKGLGWSRAIDTLAWLSCGYGVRPSYAVVWSLLTILAFALLFWLGDGIRRSARPLQGPAEVDPVPERVTFRNALFFSTMIFLSQGPIDFLPVGRHRYYVILEGILGWLLLALFLVTLGRVMIR